MLSSLRSQDRFDPFQKCDRDDAAHAAAVERQDAFRPRAKQMPVA